MLLVAVTAAVVVALALVIVATLTRGGGTLDVEPGINAASASLLQLDVLPARARVAAPGFSLTDQAGHPMSLSQFRGRAVVLSFNDDRCVDLCTLLAQDIVAADRDLGRAARDVAFVAVNANPFYPQVRYVRSWSDAHGLGREPNWWFATAAVPQLHSIWKRYGVEVQLDRQARTVVHSTQLYFIDPAGSEVAIGSFGTNAANTSLYGHAMAQMAADLLPAAGRPAVAGPVAPAPGSESAAIGGQAPAFALPALGEIGRTVSSASLRGRYAVLDFWASTCTACASELPHVEAAYEDLGRSVAFVGIDVSDQAAPALRLARRAGLTYPLAADTSGQVAGEYRVSGLPFTVILAPDGTVVTRHPGALSTEQLEYVLQNQDPTLEGR